MTTIDGGHPGFVLVNVVEAFSGIDPTGVADSGPGITTALAALAASGASGQAAFIPDGTYKIATPITIPSGCVIVGTPNTLFVSTIPSGSGNPLQAIFAATIVTSGTGSTTLASTPTLGTSTLSLSSATGFTRGAYVQITQALTPVVRNAMYRIDAISGTTITLDRPLIVPGFSAGDAVQTVSPVLGVHIHGNGMRLTGTGSRYIELYGAWKAVVEDVWLDGGTPAGAPDERLISFDVPSYDCHAVRMLGAGAGVTNFGASFESAEGCSYESSAFTNCTQANGLFQDATACYFDNSKFSGGAGNGVFFTGGVDAHTNNYGSTDCTVTAGDISDNNTGVSWATCATRCRVIGVSVNRNTLDAYNLGGAVAGLGGTCTDAEILGATADGNGRYGVTTTASVANLLVDGGTLTNCGSFAVNVPSGCKGTRIAKLDINGSGGGFNAADDIEIDGLFGSLTASVGGDICIVSGGLARLRGLDLSSNTTSYMLDVTGGVADVSQSRLGIGANGGCYFANGGVLRAAGCTAYPLAAAAGVYAFLANNSPSTIRVGDGCDPTTCGHAISILGTGFANRGQTATGSSGGTAIAWPDLKASDVVILTPTAAVFSGWVSAITPGTGFTLKDSAAGTYGYYVP